MTKQQNSINNPTSQNNNHHGTSTNIGTSMLMGMFMLQPKQKQTTAHNSIQQHGFSKQGLISMTNKSYGFSWASSRQQHGFSSMAWQQQQHTSNSNNMVLNM
jgi:hypothetical protein